MTDYDLIVFPEELQRLAETLHQEKTIAVDTESNSLFAYRERVCLIQFSTTTRDYLVDPLALGEFSPDGLADLSVLKPIFEDPQVEKIFHAAEYDLMCLWRDFGIRVNNMFDTMQAAHILGMQELGLGALLESVFGVHLDKRHQRADWGERPLTPDQLQYARLDTHYLIALRDHLYKELEARKLIVLAQEDFHHLTVANAGDDRHPPERPVDPWRISGASDLDPQQAAVLQELVVYRDKVARKVDRPLFKVISDKTLLAIALRMPTSRKQLSGLPGMTPRQVGRYAKGLLAAVQQGISAEPLHHPRPVRPDDRYLARLDALRAWRKRLGQELGVGSDVILPRDLMADLASAAPTTMDELSQIMADYPWRLKYLGLQILKALNPKTTYTEEPPQA